MIARMGIIQIIYYQKNMKIHKKQIFQKLFVIYVIKIIKVVHIIMNFIYVIHVNKIYVHYVNQFMIKIMILLIMNKKNIFVKNIMKII